MSRRWTRSLVVAGVLLAAPAGAGEGHAKGERSERAGEATHEHGEARGTPRSGEDVRTAEPGARGGAAAGTAPTESRKAEQPGAAESRELLQRLYAQSALDAATARLALQRSKDERVRKLADEIARDHERLRERLEDLGERRRLELRAETALSSGQKAHVEAMKGMGAAEFEAHFADMMAQDHRKLVQQLDAAREQARRTGDRELAALIEETRPALEEHHAAATRLGASGAGSTGSAGSSGGAGEAPARPGPADEPPGPDRR